MPCKALTPEHEHVQNAFSHCQPHHYSVKGLYVQLTVEVRKAMLVTEQTGRPNPSSSPKRKGDRDRDTVPLIDHQSHSYPVRKRLPTPTTFREGGMKSDRLGNRASL